jgi:RNA polymerase sigma-70 factor (ECF subfamily)
MLPAPAHTDIGTREKIFEAFCPQWIKRRVCGLKGMLFMATVRTSHSTVDFAAAVSALTRAEQGRLRQAATAMAFCCGMDADDLLHEAMYRTLAGRRTWPTDVALVPFLIMTMKSIANALRLKDARFVEPRDGSEDPAEGLADPKASSPEDDVLQREREAEFYALFAGDLEAETIAAGMVEGMEGEELRKLIGLDKTAYDSKRRKIRRKINKAYLVGNNND